MVKPYDGQNSLGLQDFAAHREDIELARGHFVPVPGSIAAQVKRPQALRLLQEPKGARCRHHPSKGVGPHDPAPLATLVLSQPIIRLAVADIDLHRPAVSIGSQDVSPRGGSDRW